MTIAVKIEDGTGSHQQACVSEHAALCVAQEIPDVPEKGAPNRRRYFHGHLGTGGLDVDEDMTVDGSGTAVEFYVGSEAEADLHITRVEVVIADLQVPLNRFGNIAGGIAVGFDLFITESGVDTFVMKKATTNGEVIIQSGAAWQYAPLSSFLANSNALVIGMPIGDFVPDGLRLGRGTRDRIVAVINDDLTSLDILEVHLHGYRHYP